MPMEDPIAYMRGCINDRPALAQPSLCQKKATRQTPLSHTIRTREDVSGHTYYKVSLTDKDTLFEV